ncbi:MAG TPA: RHS repeat-associated core domain-containing protein, partial [Microthrixaceae bacterium]|nr:RHS repeat-associated core domain-containing protein [Microthrixaceae bacterium]
IEMGARPYQTTLGRFLATDPIEGGTPNDYMYVADPINRDDLTGLVDNWHVVWFCKFSALACGRANSNGRQATEAANRRFGNGRPRSYGGTADSAAGDAFRHILWHALNVSEGLGFRWSRSLGKAWEWRPKGESNPDGRFDIRNNEIGLRIGQAFKTGSLRGNIVDYVESYVRGQSSIYGRVTLGPNCHTCARTAGPGF